MEYIKDINIQEAVMHILDSNGDEPVLNEFSLELNDNTYNFLYKHIEKILKDDDLKVGKFNSGRNIVKEITNNYLNGTNNNLIEISKELSRLLFSIMKGNINIESCDLFTVSLITDQGPILAILKMDYANNYTHKIDFIDNKIGIGLIGQSTMLPGTNQKIQKAAFIKLNKNNNNEFDMYVLDKIKRNKNDDEYGANYFSNSFLGCFHLSSERDMTRTFAAATEIWTRRNAYGNAIEAEKIRSTIKHKLHTENVINIDSLSNELFSDPSRRMDFNDFIKGHELGDEINIDKEWIEKKLKKIKLKIDNTTEISIKREDYEDKSKFEIIKNNDGSINIMIKNVTNYMEK